MGTSVALAQAGTDDGKPSAHYTLDTSALEKRTDEPVPGMEGVAKDGTTYLATRTGFYRNGKPWFPVSGEFHYVRYEPAEWDRELGKMQALGVEIVATYVFWNQHEAPEGTWNWEGRRNLRKFVELAEKRGMLVWLRPGPYVNAEARNGGIPEFANKGKRTNDPGYLAKATQYYNKVAEQLKGLWVKDGGPIVGVQLENEFASGDPDHITTLKKIAQDAGMVVPFYSVTANTKFHRNTAIPLQGAYVFRGWESGGSTQPVSGFVYGTDEWSAYTDIGGTYYDTLDYPRGFCELGSGSQVEGNNRFLVDGKYLLGVAWDSVGRGMNFLGYYMFHGGNQLPGTMSPKYGRSYDFQAPIGEFGQVRDFGNGYRLLHTFVREFTDELVPAKISRDPEVKYDPKQTTRLRYIGRFNREGRGFIFVNNMQKNVVMKPQENVSIAVQTKDGVVTFPSTPMTMPVDRTNVFPFRQEMNGAELLWATVQPVAKLENAGDIPTFVYLLPDWTNREMAFPAGTKISAVSGTILPQEANGNLLVHATAGTRAEFVVTPPSAAQPCARVLLITEEEALHATVTKLDGRERLLLAKNGFISSVIPSIKIEGDAGAVLGLEVFPPMDLSPGKAWNPLDGGKGWARFSAKLAPATAAPVFTPEEGVWKITADPAGWNSLSAAFVKVDYNGGFAQLLSGNDVMTDDPYHGEPWLIDLKFYTELVKSGLTLRVHDWDAKINGVTKPDGKIPALNATTWLPRREIAWDSAK